MLLDFYQKLSSGGNLQAAPQATFSGVAQTNGAGNAAFTQFGPRFFAKNVGGWANAPDFHNLSQQQAQIMIALHELGHATGAEAANHGDDDDATLAYNEKIYQNCLK